MSAIAVQLGHLRVARGFTQQQLAERTGLRRDTISALERGKSQGIEFDTLARLCDALGCTPNELLKLGATSHVAPILGGEDEDAILAERLAMDEEAIAALIANPALAIQYLTPEDDPPVRDPLSDGSSHFVTHGASTAEASAVGLETPAIVRR